LQNMPNAKMLDITLMYSEKGLYFCQCLSGQLWLLPGQRHKGSKILDWTALAREGTIDRWFTEHQYTIPSSWL